MAAPSPTPSAPTRTAPLQLQPLKSAASVSFWHELARRKLEVWKLAEACVPVWGVYVTGRGEGVPPRICLDATSFDAPASKEYAIPCALLNFNTVEELKEADKNRLLVDHAAKIWSRIESGEACSDPSLLNEMFLITFADLKRHHFYHWAAFPAFQFDSPLMASPVRFLHALCSEEKADDLQRALSDLDASVPGPAPFAALVGGVGGGQQSDAPVRVAPLTEYKTFFKGGEKPCIAFADAGTLPTHASWLAINLCALLRRVMEWHSVTLIALRSAKNSLATSLVFDVDIPEVCPEKCLGWEKNNNGKYQPKVTSLASQMNPEKLAAAAADLNLKLMKWRIFTDLDLAAGRSTRVLLLGAGTLGCNVARLLVAWGIRQMTLVDNGKVSYSNPVRQCLFTYHDCVGGGRPKAETAASALKDICPDLDVTPLALTIPMPGHPVSPGELDSVRAHVGQLESLVASHDVVFLLMDSRESRWLPTVMCFAANKPVINIALGSDSYLVMRYGTESDSQRLGCYFCNDVVVPQDSTSRRTLDQQCTVTRPGLSCVASALGVEMLMALLNHPKRFDAHAEDQPGGPYERAVPCERGVLGGVPHQLRGFLSQWSQLIIRGASFDKCTACSRQVIDRYKSEGFDFLLQVFNTPKFLEEVTGLDRLHEEEVNLDWDDLVDAIDDVDLSQ